MKKSLLYILLIFISTSCEEIFHEEESSIGKISNDDELLQAVGGVYGGLSNCFYDLSFYTETSLKGDDITMGEPDYSSLYRENDCYIGGIPLAHWGSSTSTWHLLYAVIASANNILGQYDLNTLEGKVTREILGEIFLIRAYCYFRLTRTYGEIPLIDDTEINFAVQKSSFEQIYQFIERDLKIAMSLLPKNNDAARIPYVTPHRGSAKAILAEVYLSWAGYPINKPLKYNQASQVAKEVIDSASYFGFELLNDFTWLWDMNHLYNSESLFSLYYQNPEEAINDRGEFYNNRISPYFGSSFNSSFFFSAPEVISAPYYFAAEIYFYNSYPKGYRQEITFFSTIYIYDLEYDSIGNVIADNSYYKNIDEVGPCTRPAYRKFYYEPSRIESKNRNLEQPFFIGIPRVYIYRYSQTLLTYAEASARSGQLNEQAYECFNMIRRRAHNANIYTPSEYDLPTGLTSEAFADSVVRERAWEHAGEPEGRWFDLVRLERVEELERLRHPEEGGFPSHPIAKVDYYSHIPEEDQVLNPNLAKNEHSLIQK